jgi:hypothetical protein
VRGYGIDVRVRIEMRIRTVIGKIDVEFAGVIQMGTANG